MENSRSVYDVIKTVLEIIPESETTLLNDLKKYETKLSYQAPEVLKGSDGWVPLIHILNFNIPIIKEDWQIKIREILQNNEV
jgi:hypothetical protein